MHSYEKEEVQLPLKSSGSYWGRAVWGLLAVVLFPLIFALAWASQTWQFEVNAPLCFLVLASILLACLISWPDFVVMIYSVGGSLACFVLFSYRYQDQWPNTWKQGLLFVLPSLCFAIIGWLTVQWLNIRRIIPRPAPRLKYLPVFFLLISLTYRGFQEATEALTQHTILSSLNDALGGYSELALADRIIAFYLRFRTPSTLFLLTLLVTLMIATFSGCPVLGRARRELSQRLDEAEASLRLKWSLSNDGEHSDYHRARLLLNQFSVVGSSIPELGKALAIEVLGMLSTNIHAFLIIVWAAAMAAPGAIAAGSLAVLALAYIYGQAVQLPVGQSAWATMGGALLFASLAWTALVVEWRALTRPKRVLKVGAESRMAVVRFFALVLLVLPPTTFIAALFCAGFSDELPEISSIATPALWAIWLASVALGIVVAIASFRFRSLFPKAFGLVEYYGERCMEAVAGFFNKIQLRAGVSASDLNQSHRDSSPSLNVPNSAPQEAWNWSHVVLGVASLVLVLAVLGVGVVAGKSYLKTKSEIAKLGSNDEGVPSAPERLDDPWEQENWGRLMNLKGEADKLRVQKDYGAAISTYVEMESLVGDRSIVNAALREAVEEARRLKDGLIAEVRQKEDQDARFSKDCEEFVRVALDFRLRFKEEVPEDALAPELNLIMKQFDSMSAPHTDNQRLSELYKMAHKVRENCESCLQLEKAIRAVQSAAERTALDEQMVHELSTLAKLIRELALTWEQSKPQGR